MQRPLVLATHGHWVMPAALHFLTASINSSQSESELDDPRPSGTFFIENSTSGATSLGKP